MKIIILITTTCFLGLMAGLFYSWSMSVTPGLARVSDQNYLQAFKAMNRAILNPALYIPLMGLVALLPFITFWFYKSEVTTPSWPLLAASVLYLIGVMAVTILGNIPMNNTLEALQIDSMTVTQMLGFRNGFEQKWNQLNLIRTTCCTLSFVLLIYTCLRYSVEG